MDISQAFSWWYDKTVETNLTELAESEIDMLDHHLSRQSSHEGTILMPYFGYALFQQLFESDPVLYVVECKPPSLSSSSTTTPLPSLLHNAITTAEHSFIYTIYSLQTVRNFPTHFEQNAHSYPPKWSCLRKRRTLMF